MAEEKIYDLVVIGSGPAGYTGAIRAAQLGMKVACLEKEASMGGTCLNIGCIPSKALLDSSEHFSFTKEKLARHGVQVSDVRLDLKTMMSRKDGVVKQLTQGVAGLLKKNKIDAYTGTGKLVRSQNGVTEISVKSLSQESRLKAKNVLLATGSVPVELPILKFDGKKILSSTEALSLDKIPATMVIVGGGYIGLELGSVWARLGTKVTVVEFVEAILPFADQQLAKDLFKSLQKQGLEFKMATRCLGSKIKGDRVSVEIEDIATKTKSELSCDVVLVSAGRKPYSDALGLKELQVAQDERGFVRVNPHFETSVAGIYAVGDLIGGAMLAHKAEEEAVAAVELIAGQSGHVNYGCIPSVIYTHPELASVGETEEQLKKRGADYKVGTFPYMANGRAKAMDESEGIVKIIADAKSDRVLGVHILGARASDLIAEAVSVMEFGGSSEDIARTCHGHPTLSEAVKEAAMAVSGRRINL